MRPDGPELQTPWLRVQLVDWLDKLGDREWQEQNWRRVPKCAPSLDNALDFFDDTGVLDDPYGRIGFILLNDREAAALEEFDSALERATAAGGDNDAEIIQSPLWEDVVRLAQRASAVLVDTQAT
ncbi:hypothetical protein ACFWWT_38750 [Streptomyces sp. NPDC058676]|uniref:SCO4402 family protein n=1 Tax=unclassified Streptomyces TaxID=2593676 RepID=UPI003660ED46